VEVEAGLADHDGKEAVAARIAALTIVSTASIVDALPPIKRTALHSKHSASIRADIRAGREDRSSGRDANHE